MFSAAAQTVAAFVAFLLAGYALVQTMMDAAAQSDETLIEIHESLKQRYHRQLAVLVGTTAAAILFCLSVVFLNAYDSGWVVVLAWMAAALIVGSVLGGVAFVIAIIDPKKYRKAAERLADEVRPAAAAATAPRAEFFLGFVDLERAIRQLWEQRTGGERLRRRQGPPSFREMLEALWLSEALPAPLYERLLNVSRHRNLVFHGEVQEISREILDELELAKAEIESLKDPA